MKGALRTWGPAFLAALLILWILQLCVAGRVSFWGVTPALIPLGTAVVGAREGPVPGGVFGVTAGLIWLSQSPGYQGLVLPGLCLVGLAAGLQYPATRPRFGGTLLRTATGLVVWEVCRLLVHLLGEWTALPGLAVLAGREWLWTIPWFLLLYPLFRLAFRRREKGVCHGGTPPS